jgi:hypothetical protein
LEYIKKWRHQLRGFEFATLTSGDHFGRPFRQANNKMVGAEPGPAFLTFNEVATFI